MKTKLFILWVIFSIISTSVYSAVTNITDEDFMKKYLRVYLDLDVAVRRPKLLVDDTHIYICDLVNCHIYAFSKKDGKLTAEFGQKGVGPGELSNINNITCYNDAIYASCYKKAVKSSKEGKVLSEITTPRNGMDFTPFGNGYIEKKSLYLDNTNFPSAEKIILLNATLTDLKDIAQIEFPPIKIKDQTKDPWVFFQECRKFVVANEKLYVGYSDLGFTFSVFDLTGKKILDIKHDYEKIPITQEVRNRVIEFFTNYNKSHDALKEFNRQEMVFLDFLPAYLNFFVDQNGIYVFKYPQPGDKGRVKLIFMDLNGKVLKELMIPLGALYYQIQQTNFVSFNRGKLYLIFDNEESTGIREMDLDEMVKPLSASPPAKK